MLGAILVVGTMLVISAAILAVVFLQGGLTLIGLGSAALAVGTLVVLIKVMLGKK